MVVKLGFPIKILTIAFLAIFAGMIFVSVSTLNSVHAQETDEKSALLAYVENTISTPDRQIRLNGLKGVLSSDVSFDSITIADRKGVWLKITKPRLVWSRLALLKGKLDIDSLVAERIDWYRKEEPSEALPSPEASPFALPELPVAIDIGKLSVAEIFLDESLFGLKAVASVEGKMTLTDGALDLDLTINREDGPGGEFKTIAQYLNETRILAIDLTLDEPQNGIIANLLNIEGKPPVSLKIKGNDPIDNLQVGLDFDVASRRILTGDLSLVKEDTGSHATIELGGPLSSILPERMRDFFGIESRINADALFQDNGAFSLNKLLLDSGALKLNANARKLADGFLSAFHLDMTLAPQGHDRVYLPISKSLATISSGRLFVDYDAETNNNWNGQLTLSDLQQEDIAIRSVDIKSTGTVDAINDPQNRALTFNLDGGLKGFAAKDPALTEAVGKLVYLTGAGKWKTGTPLLLDTFQVVGETWSIVSSGAFENYVFDGSIGLNAKRLAAFAPLAKRDLRGSSALQAKGKIKPLDGAFDLTLDGTTSGLSIGEPTIDPLLDSITTLAGRVARDEKGLEFEQFRVTNQEFETQLNGRFASDRSDISAEALLLNLSTITNRGSGPLKLVASIKGEQKPFNLGAELTMDHGQLASKKVEQLKLVFNGQSDLTSINGQLSSSGRLGGSPVQISADNVSADSKTTKLDGLLIDIGQSRISGNLVKSEKGLVDAAFDVNASDIGDLASLALAEANGAIRGKVLLREENGQQGGKLDMTIKKLRYEDYQVQSATIAAKFSDLFGTPAIDGDIKAQNIDAAGTKVRSLDGTINTSGEKTDFDMLAELEQQATKIKTNGSVIQKSEAVLVALDELTITSNITPLKLSSPTQIMIRDGSASFSKATLNVGGGSLVINGTAGKSMNITTDIQSLPLSIINTIRPETGAAGVLSGRVEVSGQSSDIEAKFDIIGNSVSATQLTEAGISPLAISTRGTFAKNRVNLASLNVRNTQNLDISASGIIPLIGNGLAIKLDATSPLAIVQSQLAGRGSTVTGIVRARLQVNGSLANPDANGLITISDGTLVDPLSNLKLSGIGMLASIKGKTITLNKTQANLSSGGSLSASGTIGISGDMPVDINVALNDAKYTDGQTFSTQASGQLNLGGNLKRDPLLQGTINLHKTEITVPETFGSNDELFEVKHVHPSQKAMQTLNRLKQASPERKPTSRPSIMRFNITINAPNQIFVRGRGLDAELGGSVQVKGSTVNVQPAGRFTLRRGRLSILGKRLDFESGIISLTRDLNPVLDLVARHNAGDAVAYVKLTGPASDLKVKFTSSPELPEDEVLALIIFGHGISDLSPSQIVRLASIASELTGGKNKGLVDGIRQGTGLDDLDIVQESDGNTAVQTGKYISDKVYLGVQAGKKPKATINLDITDNVKMRGAVGTQGDSSVGIFLEKDY